MIHRALRIGRWTVDFLFATEGYDIDGVLACLYDSGAPGRVLRQADTLMLSCEKNCGFTYMNPVRKKGVMLIGPTTSGAEFLDTLSHEVRHLADGIADSLGLELDSEPPAYMTGDTIRALADVVCSLGCERCRR